MQLWCNQRSSRVVYTFSGWGSGVRVLIPSTAVDVVAVGLADGGIVLADIRADAALFKLRQDWGPVSALAFRTDGQPHLLSAGGNGNLAMWDLEERRLVGVETGLHRGQTLCGVSFILGEPVALTNAGDNALRTWIFDRPGGLPRQLAERAGHAKPPNSIKFHGSDGEMVVSGSEDGTVREMSTWKDTKQQNLGAGGSMSAAKAKKKGVSVEEVRYPGIVEVVTDTAREAAWDNVVCRHRDSPLATSWTSRRHRLGSHSFLHQRFATDPEWRTAICTAVELSGCGNYVLLAYSTGHIDLWNIQSGIFRGSFKEKGEAREVKHRAHRGAVMGLASDSLNQSLVSGGIDGKVKVWKLREKKERARMALGEPVSTLRLQRESGLLAVGGVTKLIVVDLLTLRIVRNLHEDLSNPGPWPAVSFTANSQWLLALDGDGRIRVWDLPTSQLIDFLSFDKPATSLTMSPSGEFLATTHNGAKGVYLWTNRSVFCPQFAMRPLPKDWEPTAATLPLSAPLATTVSGTGDNATDDAMEEDSYSDPVQLAVDLLSLSGQPRLRWLTLPDLDKMKAAGKPVAPPKKPEAAPFFLPTTSGLRDFSFDAPPEDEPPVAPSKLVQRRLGSLRPRSAFARALEAAVGVEALSSAFNAFKDLSAPVVDMEIRNLGPLSGGSATLQSQFLRMLTVVLHSGQNWELAQSFLALFLKVYGCDLWSLEEEEEESELGAELKAVSSAMEGGWTRLESRFSSVLATLAWTAKPTI